MHVRRETVAVTTDASGATTEYTDTVTGRVLGIRYVKGDFADGVDFTITSEATGETVWAESDVNASATRAPRQAIHGTDEIGRASCRERVCQYVSISVVAVTLTNNILYRHKLHIDTTTNMHYNII